MSELLTDEEKSFFNIINGFTFRDLQTFIIIKNHLKLNSKDPSDLEVFLDSFIIKNNRIRRRKEKRSDVEKRLRKESLKNTSYGKIEYKP
jgi:hypothetical protein